MFCVCERGNVMWFSACAHPPWSLLVAPSLGQLPLRPVTHTRLLSPSLYSKQPCLSELCFPKPRASRARSGEFPERISKLLET